MGWAYLWNYLVWKVRRTSSFSIIWPGWLAASGYFSWTFLSLHSSSCIGSTNTLDQALWPWRKSQRWNHSSVMKRRPEKCCTKCLNFSLAFHLNCKKNMQYFDIILYLVISCTYRWVDMELRFSRIVCFFFWKTSECLQYLLLNQANYIFFAYLKYHIVSLILLHIHVSYVANSYSKWGCSRFPSLTEHGFPSLVVQESWASSSKFN